MSETITTLRAAIGDYPHTKALKSGQIASDTVRLAFADIPVINRAFAPMVRELRFDVSELAIATFLQARAFDKPLVLLPVVLAARFQEQALLCRADSDITGMGDLAGRRVGVRAYSQTTGLWIRGAIEDGFGIKPDQIRWVTFEDAHVAEIRDPPFAERAAAGKDLIAMLKSGEIDAAIAGNDLPDDPTLRRVVADTTAAADAFWNRHHVVPINHMVVVTRDLATRAPELVGELMRMFRAGHTPSGPREALPIGREAVAPGVALALRYVISQGMIPHPLTEDDVWAGTPPTAF